MTQFDLISFNIHKGFNLLNTKNTLSLLKEAIKNSKVDIVLLQELCGQHRETQEVQLEYLADTVWHHHAYGKNAVFKEGHHGNAILSNYPIIQSKNINLTVHQLEQRGLLHALITIPESNQNIHLLNLHINLFGFHRHLQVQKIIRYIEDEIPAGEPIIVAGDFNDWTKELQHYFFKAHFSEAFLEHHKHFAVTFPSFAPILSLDRMFYRNITCIESSILAGSTWSELSDHLAIKGTFRLD
jgi:endonuclease/exonuclease/phosphatase family metal-dependent hydrolase